MLKPKKPPRSKLEAALRDAIQHVRRQKIAGRHEQDRLDAEEWLATYDEVVRSVREY